MGQLDRIGDLVVSDPQRRINSRKPVIRSWTQEINALSARAMSAGKNDTLKELELLRQIGDYEGIIEVFDNMKTQAPSSFKDMNNLGSEIFHILLEAVHNKSRIESSSTRQQSKELPTVVKSLSAQEKRHNELFRLYLVFQEMKMNGIQADTAIYNTLINACAGAGDLDRAIYTMQLMQNDGVTPDVITYTSLIKSCALSGAEGSASIAEEFFQTMQQRTNHFSTYIEPTELTFSRLMQANLAEVEAQTEDTNESTKSMLLRTQRVWELFRMMKSRNIEPGIYAYR
jgi:pentatricopeptide repeat protein